MNRFNSPALQLAFAMIIFGLGAVFVVFLKFDAVVIAFYRLLIGAFCFAAMMLYQHQRFDINKHALFFASLGGIMLGIDLGFWNLSIRYIGPGIATILNSLQVFFMAACSIIIFRVKPSPLLWGSLCLSFIGVVLLCSNELHINTAGGAGIIMGVLSAAAFAVSMLGMREASKHQRHGLLNTMLYASIAGSLALGVFVALSGRSFLPETLSSWGPMFMYATVVHVVAWSMMAKNLPKLDVAVVGLIACAEPVAVILIDLVFLDKDMTVWQFFGATIVIIAVFVGSQSVKKA